MNKELAKILLHNMGQETLAEVKKFDRDTRIWTEAWDRSFSRDEFINALTHAIKEEHWLQIRHFVTAYTDKLNEYLKN